MIVYVVNYHRGFLLADNLHDLTDKFFGVVAKQGEFCRTQPLKDFRGCATCDVCAPANPPEPPLFLKNFAKKERNIWIIKKIAVNLHRKTA